MYKSANVDMTLLLSDMDEHVTDCLYDNKQIQRLEMIAFIYKNKVLYNIYKSSFILQIVIFKEQVKNIYIGV